MKTIYYYEDEVIVHSSTCAPSGKRKICVLCQKIEDLYAVHNFCFGCWINVKTHEVFRCLGESTLESEFAEKALRDTIEKGISYEKIDVAQPEFVSLDELEQTPITTLLYALDVSHNR